ncbi:MAG: transporter substrate-binding domain-containing protein [Anaeromyxobacter sp.]
MRQPRPATPRTLPSLAALSALALLLACARNPEPPPAALTREERAWLDAHGPLRFAPDPAFPPIEWIDEDGRYRGLMAEYFEVIERRLGARVEIVRAQTWDEVLRMARARQVDGITAAQPTPERSAYLAWTPTIIDIPNIIITRSGTRGDHSLEGLAGHRVAVTRGYALEEYVRGAYPAVQLVPLDNDLACLTEVAFGRVDATVMNEAIATWLIEKHGISNLQVAADSGRSNPLVIATRSDQPLLRSIMAKGLAAVTPAEREEIQRRWIRVEVGGVVARRTVVQWTLALVAALGALALAVLAWSRTLRRQVAAATAGLEAELAERRRVEGALRRSDRKLAVHLEQTAVAHIELDPGFRVLSWNAAAERIFGWTRDEVLGRSADLIVAPSAKPAVRELWQRLMARSGGWQSVNQNVTRDGRSITCEWFNSALVEDDGTVTGGMSMAVDVTDRERREEALARAQRLESLAVLAGGIAHDFNNLLTGILGNLSLVLADDPSPALRAELLTEAEGAARRAQALTRQLLTFARGGAPMKAPVAIGPLVQEAASFACRGRSGTCQVDAEPGLWTVEGDAGQLAQVVQNLVLNALEAMPGGTVQVELANLALEEGRRALPAGPYVRLAVVDQGRGIAPEDLPRIFDPFFSTKRTGSGLGLAVTHSIVVRHGGQVEVSPRPGGGTVFEVLLPAAPRAQPQPPPPQRLGVAPGIKARVLVMDDEPSVRSVAERVLVGAGCEVELASDGAEAVARWREARHAGQPFDLVVLDLTVPGGMGGLEALQALRALDPAVRAVVSSGYSNAAILSDHAAHGFSAVLAKPWSAEQLRLVVAEQVQRAAAI